MNRYICLCGRTFKNKKTIEAHVEIHEESDMMNGYPSHKAFKRRWKALVLEWFSRVLK